MFCNFFTFWLFFFFPTFFQLFLFFFFPRKSLKSTHSLDFLGRKKKNSSGKKKNTIFTHSVDFCPKSANFKLFRGNKKIRYLWLDGLDGLDGDQKCPLNFFILCGYIDYVYVYLYTKYKFSPTFLWVWKFHVKLGVAVKNFKIKAGRWFFFFLGLKVHFWCPKYPSIMFIPLRYIDNVYMNLYI